MATKRYTQHVMVVGAISKGHPMWGKPHFKKEMWTVEVDGPGHFDAGITLNVPLARVLPGGGIETGKCALFVLEELPAGGVGDPWLRRGNEHNPAPHV